MEHNTNTSMFTHLHVHTQYSVLDGAATISALFAKAKADGQTALAITDHGNMYGVKEFLNTAKKFPEVKPIVGCEVYVSPEGRFSRRGKEDQSSNHLILLAKNKTGYHNLVKLVSHGFIEGFYYKPRIDHELLEKYHEGLIACSACLAGEVPRFILNDNPDEAEKTALWYKNLFGDDYYLELQRHKTISPLADQTVYPMQEKVIATLLELSKKHNIKIIATNDVHFVNSEDAEAHDRLICLNTGADLDDPRRMRYSKQEWLKTRAEMAAIFADLPEALSNTMEIVEKIEQYGIDNNPIMPFFPLPENFTDADEYLRYLTLDGAEKRYGTLTDEINDRIDFELATIKRMGFPDYFLIVQDFIGAARKMGVWVGPGRGSAAGSVVAYCLQITDIDPMKYNLLFERFLNPDRISMPDIDIDFDDDGRAQVLNYVEEKYGKDHVSHVITFGTMATRSAIRDVARVQKLPLSESDRLAKAVPARWDRKTKEGKDLPITIKNCKEYVTEIKEAVEQGNELIKETMHYAEQLENSIRNTGVHACAIIIGRDNLMEYIPISTAKDKDTGNDMWVSQYEGSHIEAVGMLKMDFLGLKTLSILRNAVENIKQTRNIDIDLAHIPLDDKKTYELFSRGDTVGTFQYESDGMRKWLKELVPTRFEDLIAMNALYRPGPMDYIESFVARKHGREKISYDIQDMDEFLNDTYGITVYQEQVMLLSQKLAGFTGGQADTLRKAMGKKQKDTLAKLKGDFLAGAAKKGHREEVCNKIWSDWEAFAEYAFNKSHATCYAWVGYQTAWLKANYPAEYMAAVLSRNLDNIDEITKFMDECRRMGIAVLPPSVNESYRTFTVNSKGNIRFGMAAIKGVGAAAVDAIVDERRQNGTFKSVFDFVERVPLATINRRTVEALVGAGAFDEFEEISRDRFFAENAKKEMFLEELLRYGNKIQADKSMNTNSLFGGEQHASIVVKPEIPAVSNISRMELLNREKELTGMFLSSHPLDDYKFEMENLLSHKTTDLNDLAPLRGRDVTLGGMVSAAKNNVSKNGNQWGQFTVEDYAGTYEFRLFGKDYERFMQFMQVGYFLLIKAGVQERFSYNKESNGELEVKIKNISLLSNAKSDLKSLMLNISVDELTSAFANEIMEIVKNNPGKIEFKLRMIDKERGISLDLFSRKYRIEMSPAVIDFLKDTGLEYAIN